MGRLWIGILFVSALFSANAEEPEETPAKIIKIYSTQGGGFVGLWDNGTVTAWGRSNYGGSLPSAASTALSGQTVKEIYSNECAFAALTGTGKVVTWGGSNCGGDSSAVSSKLSGGVSKVVPSRKGGIAYVHGAFAALKSDGSVVVWGYGRSGGNADSVASQLEGGVSDVVANDGDFAALKDDGSVVTWGNHGKFVASRMGGWSGSFRSRDVSLLLGEGVSKIIPSQHSFVALKGDGRIIGWGIGLEADTLGVSHNIEYDSNKIVDIIATKSSFLALRDNGSAFAWGEASTGGGALAIKSQLGSGVKQVFSNDDSFAVLKNDGTVVTWGKEMEDGQPREYEYSYDRGNATRVDLSSPNINANGVKVKKIFSGWKAFVALRKNGTIVAWGSREHGADTTSATSALGTGSVDEIVASYGAFAILKNDGSVATWGGSFYGGDSSSVATELGSGVIQVVGAEFGFSALKNDGTVVTWGF